MSPLGSPATDQARELADLGAKAKDATGALAALAALAKQMKVGLPGGKVPDLAREKPEPGAGAIAPGLAMAAAGGGLRGIAAAAGPEAQMALTAITTVTDALKSMADAIL